MPDIAQPRSDDCLDAVDDTKAGAAPAKPLRTPTGLSLPTRLLALFLLCLLPVIAAEIYTNIDLRSRRQAELGDLAMRQSELASSDMDSLLGGVAQLLRTIAQFPSVRARDPACAADLAALQPQLPAYRFVAVLGADGAVLCSSRPIEGGIPGERPSWAADLPSVGAFAVGHYTSTPHGGAFLPITQSIPAARVDAGSGAAAIVAAVDLGWLDQHLASLWRSRTPLLPDSTVAVTDWDGAILARYPETPTWLGRILPEAAMKLIGENSPGVAMLRLPDGRDRLAAYVPASVPPVGVATFVFLTGQSVASRFDISGTHEVELVAGAALLALVLTLLAGRRFFMRPMERLLEAAKRWRDGDLGARADVGERGSEFARLAASFNQMASALELRDAELRTQAEMLEAQVAARTRALSNTNNRLQVEIAERAKTEAALRQAHKLQAVGQLAGGIAHDFNNMLATVLGSLELMERRIQSNAAGGNSEEDRRQLALIARASEAVQRGAQLTSRLLAFSRRQRLTVRPTDLNRLITDLLGLTGSTLGRGVRIRADLAADLWPALADPGQVEAAILNLCLNARDAMPAGGQLVIGTAHETVPGGPPPIGNTEPSDPAPGDYIRITVSDSGCGMTPEVLARAFEPFFSTKGTGSSGLGLSQVYGLARQSGGTVRIASLPGEGTTVSLLLRRAPDPVPPPANPMEQPRARSAPPAPRLRVLIVDDDVAVRRVTVDMLHDLGCEVVEASCAEEALALLDGAAARFGLLLIDYAMPGMNGIRLARAVRDLGVVAPIVLATGYAQLDDPADTYADLTDAVLSKPFTITELQTVLLRPRAGAKPVLEYK
jgi:signal transduction histidine kinase/ActR/RegA family two-component response regulator